MTAGVDHVPAVTFHGRKGAVRNAFTYGVDYVLVDAEKPATGLTLFSRNRRNVFALWDRDHGGAPASGEGAPWVRATLKRCGIEFGLMRIELLAQPRVLGHVFNPVSFWLCRDGGGSLRVVIAEVSNTFGDRHSYLCHRDDLAEIRAEDTIEAQKIFHVSPFQPTDGVYRFNFDIRDDALTIRIDYSAADGGVLATLAGPRRPLTNRAILATCLRRPFGSRRVLGLIHWQALKLFIKGARFRPRPLPPVQDVTR